MAQRDRDTTPRPSSRKPGRTPLHGVVGTIAADRERLYREFFESANDLLVVFAVDGRILMVNPEVERVLGYPSGELEGQHYAQVLSPDSTRTVDARNKALQEGKTVAPFFELDVRRKDGTLVPVEARTRALRDRRGQVRGYLGIFRNISERKKHEAAQQEHEAEYQTLFETVKDVVYVLDASAPKLRRVNSAFTAITGWSATEGLNTEDVVSSLVHPDDVAPTLERYRQAQQGAVLPRFTVRIKGKDGAYRIGEFSASPRLRNGQVVEIVGIARDITERVHEQQQLDEHRRLLTHIAEAMPQVLFLYDLVTQRVRYVNSRIMTCLGYTPEYLQGLEWTGLRDVLHPDDRVQWEQWLEQIVGAVDGAWIPIDVRVLHANGAYRWLQSRATVCTRQPDGAPHQVLVLAQDITPHKRLDGLLQERTINHKELGARLQKFRESLKMTQPDFGAYFGGFNQRKISSYEVGKVEIPLELLLNIRAKGYPLEAILGTGSVEAIDHTVEYMATSYVARLLTARLAEALSRLLQHDHATIEEVLTTLERPLPALDADQRKLLEQLAEVKALLR
jgi:PAS domain S-box-containing protein